ncbi:MAG: 50S ribosomal protein L6 [Oscillospiraceae bacterium]|nr:50S ribosomal protein L6 [Oscillospiraceae bacterium]
MSRIGRAPIGIPAGVDVAVNGNVITVKGPKGTMENTFHKDMTVAVENGQILVTRPSEQKKHKSLHGLTRTLISNMVEGVTNGFKKELEITGVGYRAAKQGNELVMNLGYSHQVIMPEIDGISIEVPGPNKIIISGIDKQKVGQFAAEVREKRPPEPYKGKGIKYVGEYIIRKEGKAGKGK